MREIIKSVRLSDAENDIANEMQERTGLTFSAMVKKALFQENGNSMFNSEIIFLLGQLATTINKINYLNEDKDLNLYINDLERIVSEIWQNY